MSFFPQRELSKDHYEELVRTVRERHGDPSERRFSARVGSEMKLLKMFTVVEPTVDALAFLRGHTHVSRTGAGAGGLSAIDVIEACGDVVIVWSLVHVDSAVI